MTVTASDGATVTATTTRVGNSVTAIAQWSNVNGTTAMATAKAMVQQQRRRATATASANKVVARLNYN